MRRAPNTSPMAWVRAHLRKVRTPSGVDRIVPVMQHNRIVGYMKESAMRDFKKGVVKADYCPHNKVGSFEVSKRRKK